MVMSNYYELRGDRNVYILNTKRNAKTVVHLNDSMFLVHRLLILDIKLKEGTNLLSSTGG